MSFPAMLEAWSPELPTETDLPLSPSTIRFTTLAVADVVNDLHHNEFYASMTTLANKTHLSRETVGLVMKHLCDTGVIRVLEERKGKPTRYQWMGCRNIRQVPDGPSDTYLSDHPTQTTREPQEKPQGKPSAPPAGGAQLVTTFGGEEKDTPARVRRKGRRVTLPDEGGKPPSVRVSDVFDLFVLEWQKVATERRDLAMVPLYTTEQACFAWLRHKFLAPPHGKPWKVEDVYRLVQEFVREVRYGAITPKPGMTAWQSFQTHHAKLIYRVLGRTPSEVPEDTTDYVIPDDVAALYSELGLTS